MCLNNTSFVEEELQKVRERKKQKLLTVVNDMKARGIKIDFARRASFLQRSAKNAGEIYRINNDFNDIDKKMQQA